MAVVENNKEMVPFEHYVGLFEKLDPEEEWDYNVKMYSALIPALKKYHVTCCLENMFSGYRGKIMQAICSDPMEACAYVDHLNEVAGKVRTAGN